MIRQAHHDICHPEPVEGWQRGGRTDFIINVFIISNSEKFPLPLRERVRVRGILKNNKMELFANAQNFLPVAPFISVLVFP